MGQLNHISIRRLWWAGTVEPNIRTEGYCENIR